MNLSGTTTQLKEKKIQVISHLAEIGIKKIRQEILNGLFMPKKNIPSKYFYDETGSTLFEQITQLDEYYPTRTEKSILKNIVTNIDIDFNTTDIVELGSGDHSKINLLLKQIPDDTIRQLSYYPVDISQSAIINAGRNLRNKYPELKIYGIVADFFYQLDVLPENKPRLFCFLGSTLGNLTPPNQLLFIKHLSENMKAGDHFLLGLDMKKEIKTLEKAYNDKQGITARFNLNIIKAVNRLIESDFNPNFFQHLAFYNKDLNRIEMHLKSQKNMVIKSKFASSDIFISKNETIHTENSYKFSRKQIYDLAKKANLNVVDIYQDEKKWFSLVLFKK